MNEEVQQDAQQNSQHEIPNLNQPVPNFSQAERDAIYAEARKHKYKFFTDFNSAAEIFEYFTLHHRGLETFFLAAFEETKTLSRKEQCMNCAMEVLRFFAILHDPARLNHQNLMNAVSKEQVTEHVGETLEKIDGAIPEPVPHEVGAEHETK